MTQPGAKVEFDDDLEALLDAEIAAKKSCRKCKEKLKVGFQNCQYCSESFCYLHLQAEVHGCGDRARAATRAQALSKRAGVMK